jgi:hypothetical protein
VRGKAFAYSGSAPWQRCNNFSGSNYDCHTQTEREAKEKVLSKARNTVTAAQATTTQQRTDSPPAPVSTSLASSTAPESSIAIATEGTKDEDEESGEETSEGESGEEKEPIKKGNEIKKEVTSIDVNTPIKRKEIRIYNRSFLVETTVQDPLTEEQGLLYEQLYLSEFEGEEDEAWRKQVLQEVIDGCTEDFAVTVNPQCHTFRSYLEKLALKVFETDQPILWWKDKEVEEKKEDVVYPNEENEENEEDEDEATDYEITISISLSNLNNLLKQMKDIHLTSATSLQTGDNPNAVALTNATSPYYLDPTVELSSYINPKRIMPTTDAELQELIDEAIKKLTTNKYNNSHKERIAKDLGILKILKTKTLAWLKEHANEKSELNTYGAVNVTWDYLMRAILGMYSINKTHD